MPRTASNCGIFFAWAEPRLNAGQHFHVELQAYVSILREEKKSNGDEISAAAAPTPITRLGCKKSVSQFQNCVALQIVKAGESLAAQQFIRSMSAMDSICRKMGALGSGC